MSEFLDMLGKFMGKDLFHVAGTTISVSTIVTLILILFASYWISSWLRQLVQKALGKRHPAAADTLGVLIHHSVLVVGFSSALSTAGIDLTGLFAAGAIFAVGLGFAMQSIVQNFVAGVILLTERTIKSGDVLDVDGLVVKVSELGIRASIGKTWDGEEVIVPNSFLSQNVVKNYTLSTSDYRARVEVGVSYSSDLERVKEVLEQVAKEVTSRIHTSTHTPATEVPMVIVTGFGDSSILWEVGVWMKDPWELRSIKSDLYLSIWRAFQANEIVIAFPQMDLHFDPAVMRSFEQDSSNLA